MTKTTAGEQKLAALVANYKTLDPGQVVHDFLRTASNAEVIDVLLPDVTAACRARAAHDLDLPLDGPDDPLVAYYKRRGILRRHIEGPGPSPYGPEGPGEDEDSWSEGTNPSPADLAGLPPDEDNVQYQDFEKPLPASSETPPAGLDGHEALFNVVWSYRDLPSPRQVARSFVVDATPAQLMDLLLPAAKRACVTQAGAQQPPTISPPTEPELSL